HTKRRKRMALDHEGHVVVVHHALVPHELAIGDKEQRAPALQYERGAKSPRLAAGRLAKSKRARYQAQYRYHKVLGGRQPASHFDVPSVVAWLRHPDRIVDLPHKEK